MFPQTSFCVPLAAIYKTTGDDEFQVKTVQPLVNKLQKIVGMLIITLVEHQS